jgi:hypothetical protein
MDVPWGSLISMAVIALLPLLPSFVLFKYLPSFGSTDGPFQGLRFKFTGAFAGYVFVFLCLLLFMRGKESPAGCFDEWSVLGTFGYQRDATEPEPHDNLVVVRVIPPDLNLRQEGQFRFDHISIARGDQNRGLFPSLLFERKGYQVVTIPLDPNPSAYGSPQLDIHRDDQTRVIKITSKIVMQAEKPTEQYAADTAQKPQAVR